MPSIQSSPTEPEAAVLPPLNDAQPEATSDVDLEKGNRTSRPTSDFDPCTNAHFTSPFYNHGTPCVPSDYATKNKGPVVELCATSTQSSSTSTLRKKKPCMTKPAQGPRFWVKLSKKQKLGLKLLLAVVLVGAVVGLAVGISKRVGGGVVKNNNQVTNISWRERILALMFELVAGSVCS
jgi:hypothetical protein